MIMIDLVVDFVVVRIEMHEIVDHRRVRRTVGGLPMRSQRTGRDVLLLACVTLKRPGVQVASLVQFQVYVLGEPTIAEFANVRLLSLFERRRKKDGAVSGRFDSYGRCSRTFQGTRKQKK